MNTRKTGSAFENMAARWLEDQGWRVLERNVHFREGELDLVMEKGGEILFVEVKGRRGAGAVAEALSPGKVKRMKKAVMRWKMERGDKRMGRLLFVGVNWIDGEAHFEHFWIE